MAGFWTCQRVEGGAKCGALNANRKQLCGRCRKKRPAKRKPEHMAALHMDYEDYVKLNGGEHCGICGKVPEAGQRRLDRDHDHRTGKPRGLLCHMCNRTLGNRIDRTWLRNATIYLMRAEYLPKVWP